jgi:hypothetical protein
MIPSYGVANICNKQGITKILINVYRQIVLIPKVPTNLRARVPFLHYYQEALVLAAPVQPGLPFPTEAFSIRQGPLGSTWNK